MRRVPILATIVVVVAVSAMLALGVWQIQRLHEKEALIARYGTNAQASVMAFPRVTDERSLFRRASLFCLEPLSWRVTGAGTQGFRQIAECRTGAEGPLVPVDMGSTRDPKFKPVWRGGEVTGTITLAPQPGFALFRWLGGDRSERLMLVAEKPAPGLNASRPPDVDSVPNNHLAYAIQWFAFATIALIIYALALRRRWRTRGR